MLTTPFCKFFSTLVAIIQKKINLRNSPRRGGEAWVVDTIPFNQLVGKYNEERQPIFSSI